MMDPSRFNQKTITEESSRVVVAEQSQLSIQEPYHFVIPDELNCHQKAVYRELNWFAQVLFHRFKNPGDTTFLWDLPQKYSHEAGVNSPLKAPVLSNESHYGQLVEQYDLSEEARLLLALGIAIHLNQVLLLPLLELAKYPGTYPLIGGELTNQQRRFQPSAQTFLFLACGADIIGQGKLQYNFQERHPLLKDQVVQWKSFQGLHSQNKETYDEWLYKRVILHKDYYHYFMGGQMPLPEDNQSLPLTKLNTSLTFEDLVLPYQVRQDLQPLLDYAQNGQAIFNDSVLSSGFRKGYIALLHGAPGTGKTLIATTIGKKLGLVTYQLELAQTVSKYIGETSKNINQVFRELERTIEHLKGKPSILFIDEADALVGKRSEVKDSKDRYANMDVSNLLQKLESFPGLVIMASNFQQNFDPAIKRRVDSFVRIPRPDTAQRTELWKRYLPQHLQYPTPDFAQQLGEQFRLTGAQINSIMKQVLITTYKQQVTIIDFENDLEPAIKKEYIKNEEVYSRPSGLTIAGSIKQEVVSQTRLWQEALPNEWQYLPPYLPSVLSRAVFLTQDEVQQLVTQAKSKWESGMYTYLPFREGIEIGLRELCQNKGLNWPTIYQTIIQLIEDDKGAVAPPTTDRAEKKTTVEAVNPPTDQSLQYVPGIKDAPQYWQQSLPEGFTFARKDLPRNLSRFFPKWRVEQMQELLQQAAEIAHNEGITEISYTRHVSKSFEVLGIEIPLA